MGNTRKHRGLLSGKWMLPPPASQVTHSQWPTVTVSDAATAPDFQLFLSGLTLCILLAREWGCSDHRPYSCMPHVPPSDKFSQLQQSEPLIHTVWCLSPKTMKNDRVEPPSSYQIAPSCWTTGNCISIGVIDCYLISHCFEVQEDTEGTAKDCQKWEQKFDHVLGNIQNVPFW